MSDIKAGTFQLTGFAELERKLEAFPDKLAKNVLVGAVRAGAVVIQKQGRENAPISVAPHLLGKGSRKTWITPGSLRKGIKVRLAPRKSRFSRIEFWVYVSKRLWYWKFVEFGTSKMAARPFLRKAFNTQKEKAVDAIKLYLSARIEKEAAKL